MARSTGTDGDVSLSPGLVCLPITVVVISLVAEVDLVSNRLQLRLDVDRRLARRSSVAADRIPLCPGQVGLDLPL